ncbi:hydrogenase maturation nickel metallochaperone HypA [Candidatus Woesearchaeota archaeon]|nr:hydrogenase maturation nickel metallochaperone HypA [Candidatus Woesearchaeota archaeon]
MPKCQCRKCDRIWYGWARTNICPSCGGELFQIKRNDYTKNEDENKKIRPELSKSR